MIARASIGELAARTVRLAAPLYIASLLLALGPALFGMFGLVSVAADRPWRADLLGPNWLNLLIEVLTEAVYSGGSWAVGLIVLAGLLLAPLAAFGQMIAYSFLAGGILERLGSGIAVSGTFWADCRRWFWPSLRLSLIGSVLVVVVGIGVGVGTSQAGRWINSDVSTITQLAIQALLLGWLELARAIMVQQSRRSAVRGLRQAARAFVRPVALVVWLSLALPQAGLLLAAILPPATSDPYSVVDLVKALVYGQLVAFLTAWSKVVRLAVATLLVSIVAPTRTSLAVTPDAAPVG